ncbi:MAG TPA: TonB-dependent receptor [Opitutaceae bacterium]|nr:TonB-dependent receptor [Opitutaceae bacterium]
MSPRFRHAAFLGFIVIFVAGVRAQGGAAGSQLATLKQLSLDELVNLDVSTVSRKDEPRWTVASGVDIITGEEIRRAGVQNIPDALRLATGVHVGQSSARSWAVSIRGMNVLAANKISVALDGRSLFTPFFSGVTWSAQDVLLEDIDRIEVVRGPVALWGAFAVNGFIQILTKPAWDTQGWLVSAGAGTEDPGFVSLRYGGKWNENTFYRAYLKYFQTDWTYDASGRRAEPATDFLQTGFRVDALRPENTTLTLQGDYYTNQDLPLDRLQAENNGFNVLGRWQRMLPNDSDVQAEACFDHTYQLIPLQFEELRNTVSAAFKYHAVRGRNDFLVGTNGNVSWDNIGNIGVAQLDPPKRTIHTLSLFVHDTAQLVPHLAALTLGLETEHNSFSGFEFQPTVRLAWTPASRTTVWGAVSRAVRTPVRIDRDLVFRFGSTTFFEANDDFKTEDALVAELGVRQQPASNLTLSLSTFAYRYDNVRSTEPAGATVLPQTFKNELDADSYGAELEVMYQPFARLFFKGSYRYLHLEFSRDPGSHDTTNGSAEGDDPAHVANLSAHLDLPHNWEFDTYLRYVSALPNPVLPGYKALDVRIGWRPSPQWEIGLTARNLLDRQHADFITTNSLNEQVHRSGTLKLTWRY